MRTVLVIEIDHTNDSHSWVEGDWHPADIQEYIEHEGTGAITVIANQVKD